MLLEIFIRESLRDEMKVGPTETFNGEGEEKKPSYM